jgi:hypothetical protein
MRTQLIVKLPARVAVISWILAASAGAGSVTGLPLGPAFGPAPQLTLTDGIITNDGTTLGIMLNFSTPISAAAFTADSVLGTFSTLTRQATGSTLSQLTAQGLGLSNIPSDRSPADWALTTSSTSTVGRLGSSASDISSAASPDSGRFRSLTNL